MHKSGSLKLRLPPGLTEQGVALFLGLTLDYKELTQYLKDEDAVVAGHVQAYNQGRPGRLWLFPTYPGHQDLLAKANQFATQLH